MHVELLDTWWNIAYVSSLFVWNILIYFNLSYNWSQNNRLEHYRGWYTTLIPSDENCLVNWQIDHKYYPTKHNLVNIEIQIQDELLTQANGQVKPCQCHQYGDHFCWASKLHYLILIPSVTYLSVRATLFLIAPSFILMVSMKAMR